MLEFIFTSFHNINQHVKHCGFKVCILYYWCFPLRSGVNVGSSFCVVCWVTLQPACLDQCVLLKQSCIPGRTVNEEAMKQRTLAIECQCKAVRFEHHREIPEWKGWLNMAAKATSPRCLMYITKPIFEPVNFCTWKWRAMWRDVKQSTLLLIHAGNTKFFY